MYTLNTIIERGEIMPTFKDNYFTNDNYITRTDRLEILQEYIDDWKGTLTIPDHLVDWAKNAADRWKEIREKIQNYKEERQKLTKKSNDIDEDVFNFYLKCKRLLKNQYGNNSKVQRELGIDKHFPRKRNKKFVVIKHLLERNKNSLFEEEYLAPEFINKLMRLYQKAQEVYKTAHKKNVPLLKEQNRIYDNDSKKLRTLYSWVLMFWEPEQPYLIQLGFAVKPSKSKDEESDIDDDLE